MRWPWSRRPAPAPRPRIRYAAASTAPRFGDFRGGIGYSADALLQQSLATLRTRCRALQRDNPHAGRYFQLREDNVIGETGITLSSQAKNANGELDERGNEIIETAWRHWCDRPTIDGTMTMIDALKLIDMSRARDGDVFIELFYGSEFRFQVVESDWLDETLNRRAENGQNEIRMGVELDSMGRPVAYHFLRYHRGDMTFAVGTAGFHRVVPASKIIHVYKRKRAGQTRGEPDMVSVIGYLKMLDGYRDAETTGRRVRASIGGFFKKIMPGGQSWEKELADTVGDDDVPEMFAEPGVFRALPPGWELDEFNPSNGGNDFVAYEKGVLRAIASGLGVSYITFANDLDGVSYSGGRQAILEDRARWRNEHKFLIDHVCKPLFVEWLKVAMDWGNIGLPAIRYEKFKSGAVFSGRTWPWIDPQKDIAATVAALDAGLTSYTQVAQDSGQDFADIVKQQAADQRKLAAAGVVLGQIASATKPKPTGRDETAGAGAGGESETG